MCVYIYTFCSIIIYCFTMFRIELLCVAVSAGGYRRFPHWAPSCTNRRAGPCHVHAVGISPHARDFFPMCGIPWPWTVGRCLTFTHTAALSSAAGLTTHQRRAGAWCLPCSIGQVCVTSHSVRGPHRLVLSSPHHLAVQKMPNAKHFLHQGIGSPDGVYIYSINPLETAAILGWSPPVSEYVFWQDSLMETFYLQGGLGL